MRILGLWTVIVVVCLGVLFFRFYIHPSSAVRELHANHLFYSTSQLPPALRHGLLGAYLKTGVHTGKQIERSNLTRIPSLTPAAEPYWIVATRAEDIEKGAVNAGAEGHVCQVASAPSTTEGASTETDKGTAANADAPPAAQEPNAAMKARVVVLFCPQSEGCTALVAAIGDPLKLDAATEYEFRKTCD